MDTNRLLTFFKAFNFNFTFTVIISKVKDCVNNTLQNSSE